MTPDDFISTADKLLADPCNESDKRSAISRSYYGAYHGCIESLPDEYAPTDSEFQSSESHKAVIDAVARWGKDLVQGRTDAQQAARRLSYLKKERKKADYEIGAAVDERAAASCVDDCRFVLDHIRRARERFDQTEAA
jgi:hypothetical protein